MCYIAPGTLTQQNTALLSYCFTSYVSRSQRIYLRPAINLTAHDRASGTRSNTLMGNDSPPPGRNPGKKNRRMHRFQQTGVKWKIVASAID